MSTIRLTSSNQIIRINYIPRYREHEAEYTMIMVIQRQCINSHCNQAKTATSTRPILGLRKLYTPTSTFRSFGVYKRFIYQWVFCVALLSFYRRALQAYHSELWNKHQSVSMNSQGRITIGLLDDSNNKSITLSWHVNEDIVQRWTLWSRPSGHTYIRNEID